MRLKLIIAISLIAVVVYYKTRFELDVFKTDLPDALSYNVKDKPIKRTVGIIVHKSALGDREIALRYKIAAEQLGWDAFVLKYKVSMGRSYITAMLVKAYISLLDHYFKPDFYIHIRPAYYDLIPQGRPKFWAVYSDFNKMIETYTSENKSNDALDHRYMGDYNGFIGMNKLTNSNLISLKNYTRDGESKNWIFIEAYPSTFPTKFHKANYSKVFYSGANWDKLRSSKKYETVLKALEAKGYLSVYGPSKHWSHLTEAYKGYIPNDGYSLIQKINEAGIVLVLHSDYHLEHGIPSGRIFESAAASSLIISDQNAFVKKEFGKCVKIIDFTQDEQKIVQEIDMVYKWAQNDSSQADKLAKCSHDIFIKKFTLESILERIAEKVKG